MTPAARCPQRAHSYHWYIDFLLAGRSPAANPPAIVITVDRWDIQTDTCPLHRALSSKTTGNCSCCRSTGQTDVQTDTWPLHRALRSKPTGNCSCCRSMGQTDVQTDTCPLHRALSSKPTGNCSCCRSMGQTDVQTDTWPLQHRPWYAVHILCLLR